MSVTTAQGVGAGALTVGVSGYGIRAIDPDMFDRTAVNPKLLKFGARTGGTIAAFTAAGVGLAALEPKNAFSGAAAGAVLGGAATVITTAFWGGTSGYALKAAAGIGGGIGAAIGGIAGGVAE